jgi:hypothetical protein
MSLAQSSQVTRGSTTQEEIEMTVSVAAIRAAIPDLTAPPPLLAPLVPPEVDLRNVLIPREAFAQAGAKYFGIDIDVARAFVNEAADRLEGKKRNSARKTGRR